MKRNMKRRYIEQVIITLTGKDDSWVKEREEKLNEAIQSLQKEGVRVIAIHSMSYGLSAMATPQHIITTFSVERNKELTEEKAIAPQSIRAIKQVLTPLADKDIVNRQTLVNEMVDKIGEKGGSVICFDDTIFGQTPVFTPKYMVTDILYEAKDVITFDETASE